MHYICERVRAQEVKAATSGEFAGVPQVVGPGLVIRNQSKWRKRTSDTLNFE